MKGYALTFLLLQLLKGYITSDITCKDESSVYLISNPKNCSEYIECNRGTIFVIPCPKGLVFDPKKLVCDYNPFVGCGSPMVNEECPLLPYPSNIPYLFDCSKYYHCNQGEATLMQCPEKKYFDPKRNVCDDMDKVECDVISTTTTVETTTTIPTTTTTAALTTSSAPSTTSSPTTTTNNPVTQDPICPESGIKNIIYPFDCGKFYRCINGQKILMSCPENLFFSPSTLECLYMDQVECNITTTTVSTTTSTTAAPTTTEPVTRDPMCPAQGIKNIKYPYDCSKYYRCIQGQKYLLTCPESLLFSPVMLECLYMKEVDCDITTTTAATTTSNSVCPATGSANIIYPYDCSKYYHCENGQASLKSCPENLLFSPTNLQCWYMDEVQCVEVPTTSTAAPTTSTTTSTITTTSDSFCPATGTINMFYPYDCSKFYHCANGQLSINSCPENLYFSPTHLKCLYMDEVECLVISTTTTTSVATTTSTARPTTTPTITTTRNSFCPATGTINMFYPYDCSKFYHCANGQLSINSCPENLYFSPTQLKCLYMDEVQCVEIPTTSSAATTVSTTNPTTTTSVTTTRNSFCPSSGTINMYYPYDCSKYYHCENGQLSINTCPENLYFSPIQLQCLYMDEVDCVIVTTSTSDAPTISTTTVSPTTSITTTTTTTTSDPICVTTDTKDIFYPYDCSKYYHCENGQVSIKECPENLYFSPINLECLYMDEVDCNVTTTPTPSTSTTTPKPTTTTIIETTTSSVPITTTTITTTTSGPDVCDGKPDGTYIANPADCRSFYECSNGKGVLIHCPTGTIWNEGVLACVISTRDC